MSRNMKREYISKLLKTEAPNGYKFDAASYLYNPSYDCDYPSFSKVIAEDEHTQTVRRVYYFKHYNGTGEYIAETFNRPKEPGWAIVHQRDEKILASDTRFNLKKLLSLIA